MSMSGLSGLSGPSAVFGGVPVFSPLSLAPALWLDAALGLYQDSAGTTPAASDADPVGRWSDQSGNGRHAVQTVADAKRPTLRTGVVNGRPVVRFDGVDDRLDCGQLVLSDLSIFVVFAFNTTVEAWYTLLAKDDGGGNLPKWMYGYRITEAKMQWHINTGAGSDFINSSAHTPLVAGQFHQFALIKSGLTYTHWKNGTAFGGGTGTVAIPAITAPLMLGWAESASYLLGDIAEVLVYEAGLTSGQRAQVEGYLRNKWGLP